MTRSFAFISKIQTLCSHFFHSSKLDYHKFNILKFLMLGHNLRLGNSRGRDLGYSPRYFSFVFSLISFFFFYFILFFYFF